MPPNGAVGKTAAVDAWLCPDGKFRSSGAWGLRRIGWRWRLVSVQAVGKAAQRVGHVAQCGDGLSAHLRNDCVVHIFSSMAQFHLDDLDGFFNALSYAARPRTRRPGTVWRIRAHKSQLQ